MLAHTSMIKNMGMESFRGLQEMFIRETMKQMKEQGMERCILQMAQYIKEIGQEDFKKDKVL